MISLSASLSLENSIISNKGLVTVKEYSFCFTAYHSMISWNDKSHILYGDHYINEVIHFGF